MAINKETFIKQLQEMVQNAKVPECPAVLQNERLEDAFKISEADEEGYSEEIPIIWNNYAYGKMDNGILAIARQSASFLSRLYTKYIDEKALIWDQYKERLLLYIPDEEEPKMGFKGSTWWFAKKLKPEYEGTCTLEDIYLECVSRTWFLTHIFFHLPSSF